jgi:putative DNA primase/helicase
LDRGEGGRERRVIKQKRPGVGAAGSKGFATSSNEAKSNLEITDRKEINAVRRALFERGYAPIPLEGKAIKLPGWQKIAATETLINAWPRQLPTYKNTGNLTKNTPAIDIDIYDPAGIEIVEALVRERFAGNGKLLRRVGQAPKCAFIFRTDQPFSKLQLPLLAPGEPTPQKGDKCTHKIEILGDGQQIVVHGNHPDTQKPYEWAGGEPWTVDHGELPVLDQAEAKAFLDDATARLIEAGWKVFEIPGQEHKATSANEGEYPLIIELAIKVWGPITYHSGDDYRFGSHGSKSVDFRTKTWFDFERNVGGGLRDLMKLAASPSAAASTKSSTILCAADIEMKQKEWLWPGHLLLGCLELMSGIPGLGKSQVQICYVACATAGLRWPDGAPPIEPVNVIMVTAEDALAQEVVPRLAAAEADLKRVFILQYIKTDEKTGRQFLLAEDLDQLEKDVARIGDVKLITLDPITAYMGGKADSHKATEVRSQLTPLKDFAEHNNVSVSAITHPAKNAGQRAIDHFIGSQAFIAAARIGHVCIAEMEPDEDDENKRMVPTGRILFANPKNNADKTQPTLAYRIETTTISPDGKSGFLGVPRVAWENGTVNMTADEAIAANKGTHSRSAKQREIQTWLREMLGEKQIEQRAIQEEAAKCGYTDNQLRTAKTALKVVSKKAGFGAEWLWSLPPF